jgi:purine-nucleoside phosphorylase
MSTVPEAMVASACGLRVAGLSFVSNMAAGVTGQLLDGNDVVDCAKRHSERLSRLVLDFLDLAAPST